MSEATELVRRTWARWNDGDRAVPEDEVDPEVVVHSALTQAVYRGYDGVERWMSEIDEQFSDWRLALDSVEEPREGLVVASGSISMRGRQSGLDFRQPASWILELRDGRLLTLRNFVGQDGAAQFMAGKS